MPHKWFFMLTLILAKRLLTASDFWTSAAWGHNSQSPTIMERGGLSRVMEPGSYQGESCLAGGVLGGRGPECFPERPRLFAVGSALPRPSPGSWYTSWPGEVFHFCSASCLEGEWGWASSAWQRHCWRSAASTAPWCSWRSFWSCWSSWDRKEKGPWGPTPCQRPAG